MTRIYAIANQKGGVGKTTTAVNLATALASIGQRVLMIDLDPQGNASTGFGITKPQRNPGSYELLIGAAKVEACIRETMIPKLHVLPASVDLSAAEVELFQMTGRNQILRQALAGLALPYDYVFIDCPPSLGVLTLNALTAAHSLFIPMQCEFYALEGLSQLLRTMQMVKEKLNPSLDLGGVVLTMVDRRNTLSRQVEMEVRDYLGDKVFNTRIPRNIRISEAPSHGIPALIYDHTASGVLAYAHLARELLKKERQLAKAA
jgi:chromosome partitioning protein